MYLKYGSYTHALDEAEVAIVEDVERDQDEAPLRSVIRWSIRGLLQAADTDALITAMRALEAAYASDGSDIYILKDDQTTVCHSILSRETDGGVKIVRRPSYPIGRGAELSTYRSYEITIEAVKAFTSRLGAVLSYVEQLTISGGGPRYSILELRNGAPQVQLVSQQTAYTATQSGQAVGYNDWPDIPPPYWGAPIFDQPNSSYSRSLPKLMGSGRNRRFREYPISWSYRFQSASPLSGSPNRRY